MCSFNKAETLTKGVYDYWPCAVCHGHVTVYYFLEVGSQETVLRRVLCVGQTCNVCDLVTSAVCMMFSEVSVLRSSIEIIYQFCHLGGHDKIAG